MTAMKNPKSTQIEQRFKQPLMTATRKCGTKKRMPITASAPGWKAPKKSGITSGMRRK